MKTLKLQGNKLTLNTPYDQDEVASLKASFPRARWDRLNKVWLLPVTDLPKALNFAEAWGITVDDELQRLRLPEHPIGQTSIRRRGGKLKIRLPYEQHTQAWETTESAQTCGKPQAKTGNYEQTSNTTTCGKTITPTTHAYAGRTNTLDKKTQKK